MCVRVCVCARVWAVRRLMDDGGASTAEWVDSWFPSQEPSLAHTLSSIAGDPAPGSRRSATEGDLQKEKKKDPVPGNQSARVQTGYCLEIASSSVYNRMHAMEGIE